MPHGSGHRKIGHAQDLYAPAAVCDLHLLPRLHRSHQRELRRPDDARRSRHVRHRLRVRRGHLLLGLFHLRGSQQRDHGKGRRAAVDCAHHDHLGHFRRPDRPGDRPHQFLRGALPAGRRRGRLLSGHRALLHLLVPGPSPCAHRLGLPDRPADRGGRRRTDLHRTARPRRRVGPARLAMDVYRRGNPDHRDRCRHILRPHRQAGAGDFPHRRGEDLAQHEAARPSAEPRRR